jgi:hypothetical protein
MKKLFLPLVTAIALLTFQAPAELILYKGTGKATYTGNGQSFKANFRSYVVIDNASNQVATILYANIFGTRVYLSGTEDGLNRSTISGANGKTHTALTQPIDDDDEGIELIVAQGVDSSLPLSTNVVVQFPKKLTSVQQTLVTSGTNKHLVSGNLNATFDKNGTQASNHTGETLSQAVERLINGLQALGYSEAGSLPGGSGGLQSSGGIFTMSFSPTGALAD